MILSTDRAFVLNFWTFKLDAYTLLDVYVLFYEHFNCSFRQVEILDVCTLEVGACSDDCTSEWTFVCKRPDICSFRLLVIGY